MIGVIRTLVAAAMLACLGMQAAQPDSTVFKQYVSSHKIYSLEVPSTWEVKRRQGGFGPFIEPPVMAHDKNRGVQFSIDVEKDDRALVDIYKGSFAFLKWYQTFELIREKDFRAGKLDGKELIYSVETHDHHRMQIIRFYLVDRGFMCELVAGGSPDDLERQQVLFETIAASFKFVH